MVEISGGRLVATTAELRSALKMLRAAQKSARILTLSFDGTHLELSLSATRAQVAAQGEWRGVARTEISFIRNLLASERDLPEQIELMASNDRIGVGQYTVRCSWQ
jgi:hypothetical protein